LLAFTGVLNSLGQTNELIIIGTLHSPMPNFNADTLIAILERVKPDIILEELDSSFFTQDFKYKSVWKGNEVMATVRYVDKHPETLIRPMEFEGRNKYKNERGIGVAELQVDGLLDSLYKKNILSKAQSKILGKYYELSDSLNAFVNKNAYDFNNKTTDNLARKRQYYQHHKIRNVVNARAEFSKRFITTSKKEKITLSEGYNRLCDFWDLRNQTMAKNIYNIMKLYPGKRVVVQTGFFHRYYLIEELLKLNKDFKRLEYYEVK
jgi:hypothetical protein